MLVVRYRCTSNAHLINEKAGWKVCWAIPAIGLSVMAFGFFYARNWIAALVVLGLALLTAFVATAKDVHERMERRKRSRNAEFAKKYSARHRINSLDSAAMRRATEIAVNGRSREYEMPPVEEEDQAMMEKLARYDICSEIVCEKQKYPLNIMTVAELESKLNPDSDVDAAINTLIERLDCDQTINCRN